MIIFWKIGRNRRVEMHKDETDGGRKVLGKKGAWKAVNVWNR